MAAMPTPTPPPTEAQKRLARTLYAAILRNNFLDKGMNVKVVVSGKDSKRISMSYALFDAVWMRKLERDYKEGKNGLLNEIRGYDFKEVCLRNYTDYGDCIVWK